MRLPRYVLRAAPPDPDAATVDGEPASLDVTPQEALAAEPVEAAPQPLTSLSSLLGGSFTGGQACDADGRCD